jgi:hypothetical protein
MVSLFFAAGYCSMITTIQLREAVMADNSELMRRQNEIIEEMRAIRSLRRGSVTEQFLQVRRKGQKEPSLCGPYWVFTRKEKGKTVSQRLSREEAEKIRKDVEGFHRFQELCRAYVDVTEELGVQDAEVPSVEQKKKQRKSRSKRTRK